MKLGRLATACHGVSGGDPGRCASAGVRRKTGRAALRVERVRPGQPARLPVDAASKRAFLLASGVETGATFAVKSGATTVYSAPDRRRPRLVELVATRHVYALDFHSVTAAGTYTIAVTGPIAATSPSVHDRHRRQRVRRCRWRTR